MLRAHQGLLALRVRLVRCKALRGLQGLLDRVRKAWQGRQAHKVFRASKVFKASKEFKARQGRRVLRAILAQ